jgi:hypothetical protein
MVAPLGLYESNEWIAYSDGLGTQCLFPTAWPFLQPGTGVRTGVGVDFGLSALVAPTASGSADPATGFSKPSETSGFVSMDPACTRTWSGGFESEN